MPEPLLKWLAVSDSNLMLNHASTTKFIPIKHETSWKDNTRSHATVAFQGVQLLRPSRSNFFISFCCRSATDRGWHLSSAPRTTSISRDISVGGTGNAETTLATCMPFFRKITDSDMFLTTTDTLLLLILSLVYACRTCNPGGRGHTPQAELPQPSRVSP